MKKTLLFFCISALFLFSYFGRYQPVSLDLVQPETKEVEIKGEVQNPGVYTIKWEGSIKDVVDAAGGFSDQADTDSLSLVQTPADKDVIVVKKKEENHKKVSINTATIDELTTLTGIGPALAQRIVDYRQQTPFQSLEQIQQVKGIGAKMFEKIKDDITL